MSFFTEIVLSKKEELKKKAERVLEIRFVDEEEYSLVHLKHIPVKRLLVTCPICGVEFVLKDKVTNEDIMRNALKLNFNFYWESTMINCPNSDFKHRKDNKNVEDWYKGYC